MDVRKMLGKSWGRGFTLTIAIGVASPALASAFMDDEQAYTVRNVPAFVTQITDGTPPQPWVDVASASAYPDLFTAALGNHFPDREHSEVNNHYLMLHLARVLRSEV